MGQPAYRAMERAVKQACFRYNALLEEIDYTFERGLDRNQVERLAALEFVRDRKDLFITGPTGTGKSYLATALDDFGMQAFDSQGRGIMMDLIEDRHQKRSTLITSQVPVKNWHNIIAEKNRR